MFHKYCMVFIVIAWFFIVCMFFHCYFISFALIIFYLSKDEITFILYVTIIITLWSIIWLTTLRSIFIATKPNKEWGKIAKMIVLYVLITVMLEIFIKFAMRFDTIASTLFLYELLMMVIECAIHFVTFVIGNFFSLTSKRNFTGVQ